MGASHHPRFTCHPTRDAASTVVAVGGELDLFSVRLLRRLVEDAIGAVTSAVVVDLGDTSFGDLSALAYLLETREVLNFRAAA